MDTDDVLDVIENETKENIENLLRYYECDDSILVDSIKCMAGSSDGDNYMSVVKRVIVKLRQNNNYSGECTTYIVHFMPFPQNNRFFSRNHNSHSLIHTYVDQHNHHHRGRENIFNIFKKSLYNSLNCCTFFSRLFFPAFNFLSRSSLCRMLRMCLENSSSKLTPNSKHVQRS